MASSPDRPGCHHATIGAMCLGVVLMVLGVWVQYQQLQVAERVTKLEEMVERLTERETDLSSGEAWTIEDENEEYGDPKTPFRIDMDGQVVYKITRDRGIPITRSRRSTKETGTSIPAKHRNKKRGKQRRRQRHQRHQRMQKKNKKSRSRGCQTPTTEVSMSHFTAELDTSLTQRSQQGSWITNAGVVLGDTITPQSVGQPYKFWRTSNDSDTKTFEYMNDTGRVIIRRGGTFLIYAQVLYNESGPRHAYSVRADTQPLATCLTTVPNLADGVTTSGGEFHTCSLTLAAPLAAGVAVDVCPMYKALTVIARPRLTYWGLVRLGS